MAAKPAPKDPAEGTAAGQAQALTATPSAGKETGFHLFGKDGPSFFDVLDIINPLQHIPLVSTLYQSITGDKMNPGAEIAGGALYGGPIGAALAVADVAVAQSTGEDIGTHVASLFESKSAGTTPQLANADATKPSSGQLAEKSGAPPETKVADNIEVLKWAEREAAFRHAQMAARGLVPAVQVASADPPGGAAPPDAPQTASASLFGPPGAATAFKPPSPPAADAPSASAPPPRAAQTAENGFMPLGSAAVAAPNPRPSLAANPAPVAAGAQTAAEAGFMPLGSAGTVDPPAQTHVNSGTQILAEKGFLPMGPASAGSPGSAGSWPQFGTNGHTAGPLVPKAVPAMAITQLSPSAAMASAAATPAPPPSARGQGTPVLSAAGGQAAAPFSATPSPGATAANGGWFAKTMMSALDKYEKIGHLKDPPKPIDNRVSQSTYKK